MSDLKPAQDPRGGAFHNYNSFTGSSNGQASSSSSSSPSGSSSLPSLIPVNPQLITPINLAP